MARDRREMVYTLLISNKCGWCFIKRITCGWSDADYKTTLYLRLNRGGIGKMCDCNGFYYKRKCYHLDALERWARQRKEQSNGTGQNIDGK